MIDDLLQSIRRGGGRKSGIDVSGAFALHILIRGDGDCEFRGGSVDGSEGEDVEEEETAVVEEVFDTFFGEAEVCIGEDGDVFDRTNAVDMRDDLLHGQVPVLVHERFWAYGENGDVPGFDGWGWSVGGEEFEIEGVEVVDGDHAFTIIVEV